MALSVRSFWFAIGLISGGLLLDQIFDQLSAPDHVDARRGVAMVKPDTTLQSVSQVDRNERKTKPPHSNKGDSARPLPTEATRKPTTAQSHRQPFDHYGDLLPHGVLGRYGTIRFRSTGAITGLQWSHDSKSLATCGPGSILNVWNSIDGARQAPIATDRLIASSVAFANKSPLIACTGRDGTIAVYDLQTHALKYRLTSPSSYIPMLTFSPDDQHVTIGSPTRFVEVRALSSGRLVHSWPCAGHCAVARRGNVVAVTDSSNTLSVYDTMSGQLIGQFATADTLCAIAFSADGQWIVYATNEHLRLVSIHKREAPRSLLLSEIPSINIRRRGPMIDMSISSIATTSSGRWLALGTRSGAVVLLDALRRIRTEVFDTLGPGPVASLFFTPDDRMLAASCGLNGPALFDSGPWRPHEPRVMGRISGLSVSSNGKQLATIHEYRNIQMWATDTDRLIWSTSIAGGLAMRAVFSPDGDLVVRKADDRLEWLNAATGDRITPSAMYRTVTSDIVWDATGKFAALANAHGVEVIERPSGKKIGSISLPTLRPTSVTLAPDGRFVVVGVNRKDSVGVSATGVIIVSAVASCQLTEFTPLDGSADDFCLTPLGDALIAIVSTARPRRQRWLIAWEIATLAEICRMELGMHEVGPACLLWQEPLVLTAVTAFNNGRTGGFQFRDWIRGTVVGQASIPVSAINELRVHNGKKWAVVASGDGVVTRVAIAPPIEGTGHSGQGARSLEELWNDLRADTPKAMSAISELGAHGEKAVSFLSQRLRPRVVNESIVKSLLQSIDSTDYSVRQMATGKLLALRPGIDGFLKRAKSDALSVEQQTRLAGILSAPLSLKIDDPEIVRSLRAIRVLYQIGSDEATLVLRNTASGSRGFPETDVAHRAVSLLQSSKSQ